jgi:hypothetical protein
MNKRYSFQHSGSGTEVSDNSPLPVKPSTGATGFRTSALLNDGVSYVSNVLDIMEATQIDTRVVADQDGTMTFDFLAEDKTTVLRTLTVPYVAADGFQLYSAPAFTPYVRYTFLNDSGVNQSGPFYFETKILTTALSPQVLRLDGNLFDSMVASVDRSVLAGKELGGTSYENLNITGFTNNAGTQYSLTVVEGARPSLVKGRTRFSKAVDATADSLFHTVTGGQKLYVTDLVLSFNNDSAAAKAKVEFQDGIVVGGTNRFSFLVREATAGESAVTTISHHFHEPLEFSTGVWLEFTGTGPLDLQGVLCGYEE